MWKSHLSRLVDLQIDTTSSAAAVSLREGVSLAQGILDDLTSLCHWTLMLMERVKELKQLLKQWKMTLPTGFQMDVGLPLILTLIAVAVYSLSQVSVSHTPLVNAYRETLVLSDPYPCFGSFMWQLILQLILQLVLRGCRNQMCSIEKPIDSPTVV